MNTEQLRKYIRQVIFEQMVAAGEIPSGTTLDELVEDTQSMGDPLKDVELNQQPSKQGSDEKNSPTVSVKAGGKGKDGQRKPVFSDKTKQAK